MYPDPQAAINDLLYTTYKFDDKPHQLFSCIMKIADQYARPEDKPEIMRLMEHAYNTIGKAREVWHPPTVD